MTRTELLIVGAGFAGLPIALACANAGWQVTLVDEQTRTEPTPNDPLNQRCTAISSASEGLLKRWGVWDAIEPDATKIRQVQISQKGYLGSVHLDADDLSVTALGHVVENRSWIKALSDQVDATPNIQWLRGKSIAHINPMGTAASSSSGTDADAVVVELESGETFETKLLIAADGIHSRVRSLSHLAETQTDFEQYALMSTLRFSQAHGSTAYERFTPSGPLALLPRPNNHMSLVWCLPKTDVDHWADASDASVIEQLQNLFGFKLGRIEAIGPKVVVPLVRRETVKQTSKRTLLLGNAARLLHPVAGQGFNLVLRDVVCLLDLIGLQNDRRAPDPGSEALLEKFVALRHKDQQRVVWLTDGLAKGFLGEASLPAHVRGLGLMGLNSIAPLRRHFARSMMGYTG